MENLGAGDRYFVIPIIAWTITLILLSFNGNKKISYFSRSLIVLMLVLVPFNFSFPGFVDTDFDKEVAEFEHAPSGTEMTFHENPQAWIFVLTKK
jgi:hypothetical protein